MRQILLALSAVCLVIALILLMLGISGWWLAWLILEGSIVLVSLLLERWRYRPSINRRAGNWKPTGERFVDPATGRLVQVMYNPDTGERDYVTVDRKS